MRRAPILLVTSLVAIGCRKETIDKPDPPDMAAVLASFDAPTGTFDATTAAAVKAAATDAANGLVGTGLPQQLVDEAHALIDKASGDSATADGGLRTQSVAPRSFEGEGFARVTRICDGWGAAPVPDQAANGSLQLTVNYTNVTLDPVVWGTADACKLTLASRRVFVDRIVPDAPPNVRIHLGGATRVQDIGTKPVTIAVEARAKLDDVDVKGDFAVRVTAGAKTIELAVPLQDGDVVVTLEDKTITSVRAKNGTFTCSATSCKGAAGEIAW